MAEDLFLARSSMQSQTNEKLKGFMYHRTMLANLTRLPLEFSPNVPSDHLLAPNPLQDNNLLDIEIQHPLKDHNGPNLAHFDRSNQLNDEYTSNNVETTLAPNSDHSNLKNEEYERTRKNDSTHDHHSLQTNSRSVHHTTQIQPSAKNQVNSHSILNYFLKSPSPSIHPTGSSSRENSNPSSLIHSLPSPSISTSSLPVEKISSVESIPMCSGPINKSQVKTDRKMQNADCLLTKFKASIISHFPNQYSCSSSSPLLNDNNEHKYSFLEYPLDDHQRPLGHPDYDPQTLYIPSSILSSMTSFESQYWKIKRTVFDKLVFFNKGKFYELMEKDALIVQRELGLALTKRANMRMCGIPVASFEKYATKLIAKGYKICRVEQEEKNCFESSISNNKKYATKARDSHSHHQYSIIDNHFNQRSEQEKILVNDTQLDPDDSNSKKGDDIHLPSANTTTAPSVIIRSIAEIITPGTITDEAFLSEDDTRSPLLMAITMKIVNGSTSMNLGKPCIQNQQQDKLMNSHQCSNESKDTSQPLSIGNQRIFSISLLDASSAELIYAELLTDEAMNELKTLLMQIRPKEIIFIRETLDLNVLRIIKSYASENAALTEISKEDIWDISKVKSQLDKINLVQVDCNIKQSGIQSLLITPDQGLKNGHDKIDHRDEMKIQDYHLQHDSFTLKALGLVFSYLSILRLTHLLNNDQIRLYGPNFHRQDQPRSLLASLHQYIVSPQTTSSTSKSQSLVLDSRALESLQIIENPDNRSVHGTLFELVNHTRTAFGKRLLVQWICHPLANTNSIVERQDVIEFLIRDIELRERIKSMLDIQPDLPRWLVSLTRSRQYGPKSLSTLTNSKIPGLLKWLVATKSIRDFSIFLANRISQFSQKQNQDEFTTKKTTAKNTVPKDGEICQGVLDSQTIHSFVPRLLHKLLDQLAIAPQFPKITSEQNTVSRNDSVLGHHIEMNGQGSTNTTLNNQLSSSISKSSFAELDFLLSSLKLEETHSTGHFIPQLNVYADYDACMFELNHLRDELDFLLDRYRSFFGHSEQVKWLMLTENTRIIQVPFQFIQKYGKPADFIQVDSMSNGPKKRNSGMLQEVMRTMKSKTGRSSSQTQVYHYFHTEDMLQLVHRIANIQSNLQHVENLALNLYLDRIARGRKFTGIIGPMRSLSWIASSALQLPHNLYLVNVGLLSSIVLENHLRLKMHL